ncbi:MAG: phosphorylcholine transferase LicD [Eubacterium sp.]
MKEIMEKELRQIQVDILKYIDQICKENDIQYSIAYGTLIGAVRHKGYIPWDDDIDIVLLRTEYEKLLDILYKKNDGYRVLSPRDKKYYFSYAKLSDERTMLIEKNWKKIEGMGVNIDIFPLDGWPTDNREAYFKEAMQLRSNIESCMTDIWYYHPKKYMRVIKYLVRYGKVKKIKKKESDYHKTRLKEFLEQYDENQEYVGYIPDMPFALFPREMFQNYTDMKFENETFRAVKDYDTFLKPVYGDYMQLPPEEKRVSNHDFKAYWR